MADISAPLQIPDSKATDRDAAERDMTAPRAGGWARVGVFFDRLNSVLSYAKGLPVITVIGSLLVGYFQYESAYQDKVSAQAKDDLGAATSTFSEVSNAFSEAQTLQQILFYDYVAALADNADGDAQALETKNAQAIFLPYDHARTSLRQNSDLLARKAEIYIDWASDFGRDAADTKTPTSDPLNQSLLGVYNFDCDDTTNVPHFELAGSDKPMINPAPPCPFDRTEAIYDPPNTYVRLCAKDDDGKVIPDKPAITLHWYSAKHQVLAMHYCFEGLHKRLLAARDWASQSSLSAERKAAFVAERDQMKVAFTNQALRLNAFMSLVMFQIENIRVKYRPVGFACHIPFVTPFINLLSNYCTPVRTAPVHRAANADEPAQRL